MQQRSEEWFAARLGKATASRIPDVVAKTKTGYGASRANYKAELVVERLTGQQAPSYSSQAMEWGTDKEPEARAAYAFHADCEVVECGFFDHPSINMCGASPDGLIGTDGLVEIKCPNTATHIDTLLSGAVPAKYVTQALWQMACTGRQWVDYVSFDPRLPEPMRLFVKRIPRDDIAIAEMSREVITFLGEVAATVDALREKYELKGVAA